VRLIIGVAFAHFENQVSIKIFVAIKIPTSILTTGVNDLCS